MQKFRLSGSSERSWTHPSGSWDYFLQSCCPAGRSPLCRDSQGWFIPHPGLCICLFWTALSFWRSYLQLVELPLNGSPALQLPPAWCHLQACREHRPPYQLHVGAKAHLLSQRVMETCYPEHLEVMKINKNPTHICADSICALVLFQHLESPGLIEGWETAQALRFGLELGI